MSLEDACNTWPTGPEVERYTINALFVTRNTAVHLHVVTGQD